MNIISLLYCRSLALTRLGPPLVDASSLAATRTSDTGAEEGGMAAIAIPVLFRACVRLPLRSCVCPRRRVALSSKP